MLNKYVKGVKGSQIEGVGERTNELRVELG